MAHFPGAESSVLRQVIARFVGLELRGLKCLVVLPDTYVDRIEVLNMEAVCA